MISVILPTYNEADNIQIMIPRLYELFVTEGIEGEIIVVDDDSPDETAKIAEKLSEKYPVFVHLRKGDRGLSKAVIHGLRLARGDICVVMDADLSHPVEKISELIQPIAEDRCDLVVGSRYKGEGGWAGSSLLRESVSKIAGFLARGVTSLSDPTSGFMAVRKHLIEGQNLDPLGWKIVLEVAVKTNSRIDEIPFVFAERMKGRSKFDFKAQYDYLRHLWRLYSYKYPQIIQFFSFCLVGISGLIVDTILLVGLVEIFFVDPRIAAVFGFFAAVTWNYILNRSWTFNQGKKIKIGLSYPAFFAVCLIGLGIRIALMHLLIEYAGMGETPWYILASLLGIFAATLFNFLGSKYIVFKGSSR